MSQQLGAPKDSNESLPDFRADISRIVKYAPAKLLGREHEIELLNQAWGKVTRRENQRPHILSFVALGGEGKTSLVAKWVVDEMLAKGWPGCDAAFAWSFYHQGTDEKTADSSDLFLKEAISFFGDDSDKEFAASNAGAYEKGQRLARIVGAGRNLLVLDGVEPLQYAPTSPTPGEFKDLGLASLLKGMATASKCLCLVTTRYSIPDLKAFWQTTAPEKKLTRLSPEAGVHLLKTLGVKGTRKEFETLVEDVKGHALTLNLLGTYLRDAHGGDIRRRDLVKLEEADAEAQSGHAFRVMDAYVESFQSSGQTAEGKKKGRRALALLRLLSLFDRPASANCLNALWTGEKIAGLNEALLEVNEAQRNLSLKRLEDAKLLNLNRSPGCVELVSVDAHPLVREYFATQLRRKNLKAWREGHRRLYTYLCESTKEGDQPTLEDLQPLYQAVVHGCQAGLQQETCDEVFVGRILRGAEHYSWRILGLFGSDLGAAACFFESPWNRVSPSLVDSSQAFVLNQTSLYLSAVGRLKEALPPLRAATHWAAENKDWRHAATGAGNLSELELTLGEVAAAVRDSEQAVTYADRSGEAFERLKQRVKLADGLHQADRRDEAKTRFVEAEQMQAEHQPEYPRLYGMAGFWYCDLLLAAPERATWHEVRKQEAVASKQKTEAAGKKTDVVGQKSQLVKICHDVAERAAQALEIVLNGSRNLLDIALNHLTLGRAALYGLILDPSAISNRHSAIENVSAAVSGLHRASTQDHIPRGLLTRGWLRFITGAHTGADSAQEDLDQAWEIAERSSMKLFMADIHLYRARLFGGMKDEGGRMNYPWNVNPDGTPRGPKDDLAAARKLIEECGYWRRKEELEDAEEAAKNW